MSAGSGSSNSKKAKHAGVHEQEASTNRLAEQQQHLQRQMQQYAELERVGSVSVKKWLSVQLLCMSCMSLVKLRGRKSGLQSKEE